MQFLKKEYIFLELELISFKIHQSTLFTRLVNDQPKYLDEFLDQKAKFNFENLHITNVHWESIEKILTAYRKADFVSINFKPIVPALPDVQHNIKIKTNEFTFSNGKVHIDKILTKLDLELNLEIHNP